MVHMQNVNNSNETIMTEETTERKPGELYFPDYRDH